MRDYEAVIILDPRLDEASSKEAIERFTKLVQAKGEVTKVDSWGRRRLAYEIDHKPEGVYHLLTFAAEPATLDEVSRVLKITDGVMRHMAVRRVKGASTRPPEPGPEVPVATAASTSQDSEPESTA